MRTKQKNHQDETKSWSGQAKNLLLNLKKQGTTLLFHGKTATSLHKPALF